MTFEKTRRCFHSLLFLFLGCFAVFLQMQLTLFSSPDYQGLRVNLADLLLPIAGLFILVSLLLKKSKWPTWQKPFGYWALLLLTGCIVFGILNGYRLQSEWNQWALLNKGIGWIIVLSYFGLGAWLCKNYFNSLRQFFNVFLIFFSCFLIFEIILRILIHQELISSFDLFGLLDKRYLAGMMANRNAYAFLYLSLLIIGSVFLISRTSITNIQKICFLLLWLAFPVFFVMCASRSVALVMIPFVLFLLIANWRVLILKILPLVVIGLCIIPFANQMFFKNAVIHFEQSSKGVLSSESEGSFHNGDQARVQALDSAFTILKEHPFTGGGLGSIYQDQLERSAERPVIMDSTPIWILVEMGPIAFLIFAVVFITMLMALRYKSQKDESFDSVFAYSMIFVLLGLGIFSLTHEILYTRFLWVLLGFGLTIPAARKHQSE